MQIYAFTQITATQISGHGDLCSGILWGRRVVSLLQPDADLHTCPLPCWPLQQELAWISGEAFFLWSLLSLEMPKEKQFPGEALLFPGSASVFTMSGRASSFVQSLV